MTRTVDFFFDFLSPYAYYARHGLAELAAEADLRIAYRPVDLRRLKLAAGNTGPATVQMPRKLAYALRDFERWAARYRIAAASSPSCLDVRDLHAGVFHAAGQGRAAAYVQAGFDLVWGQGGVPQAPASIFESVAERAGLDLLALQTSVATAAAAQALESTFEDAVARGVFGVPSFCIDGQLWWGNDRLFMLEEHLAATATPTVEGAVA